MAREGLTLLRSELNAPRRARKLSDNNAVSETAVLVIRHGGVLQAT